MSQKLIIVHKKAPGDTLVLTGFIRDLHRAYPNQYVTDFKGHGSSLFENNPYITPLRTKQAKKGAMEVTADYGKGLREQKNETIHFLSYFHRWWERKHNQTVPVTDPIPDLHLSPEEQQPVFNGRYWVINAGGKSDFTCKIWEARKFQQVVDRLNALGINVVQVGTTSKGPPRNWHPQLKGVINLLDRTNLRDLMRIVKHADGVICGVTMLMHMAAALERPCIVLAGGREAWWWEAYVRENKGLGPKAHTLKNPHRFLHTIGQLDCCKTHGCWKNKVIATGTKDPLICKLPVSTPGQTVPKCLHMITVDHVVGEVMSHYEDNSLPALGSPKPVLVPPQTTPPVEKVVSPPENAQMPTGGENRLAQTNVIPPSAPVHGTTVKPSSKTAVKVAQPKNGQLLDIFSAPAPAPESPPEAPAPEPLKDTVVIAAAPPAATGVVRTADSPPLQVEDAPAAGAEALQLVAPLQGKDKGFGKGAVVPNDPNIFNNPIIGGKFTFCILFYGDYFNMHKQCLDLLIQTVPQERREIRVATNAACAQTISYIESLQNTGDIQLHYFHENNDYKYPVMREMFHDPAHPITTNYTIWFDDDTLCNKKSDWLTLLAAMIIEHHPDNKTRMFGPIFTFNYQPSQMEWIKQATWYRGRNFQTRQGKEAPNANSVRFVTGSFWAVETAAIKQCDIPDSRIEHNGGDYMIGEQMWQNGYQLKAFSNTKQHVQWSSVKRRGASQRHTGM
jgi:ADP-heptose:LPS heptosyltransferase